MAMFTPGKNINFFYDRVYPIIFQKSCNYRFEVNHRYNGTNGSKKNLSFRIFYLNKGPSYKNTPRSENAFDPNYVTADGRTVRRTKLQWVEIKTGRGSSSLNYNYPFYITSQ